MEVLLSSTRVARVMWRMPSSGRAWPLVPVRCGSCHGQVSIPSIGSRAVWGRLEVTLLASLSTREPTRLASASMAAASRKSVFDQLVV